MFLTENGKYTFFYGFILNMERNGEEMRYNGSKEKRKNNLLRSVIDGLFGLDEYLEEEAVVELLEEVLALLKEKRKENSVLKPKQMIPLKPVYEKDDILGETELFQPQDSREDFKETTLLQTSMRIPFLVRKSTKEKILINRDVFKIGKERSYVDYYVDNDAVSRSHADIIRQKDIFFVIDHNSLNHTFLEGKKIPAKQYVRLESGQSFMLANEEFTFYYEAINAGKA